MASSTTQVQYVYILLVSFVWTCSTRGSCDRSYHGISKTKMVHKMVWIPMDIYVQYTVFNNSTLTPQLRTYRTYYILRPHILPWFLGFSEIRPNKANHASAIAYIIRYQWILWFRGIWRFFHIGWWKYGPVLKNGIYSRIPQILHLLST